MPSSFLPRPVPRRCCPGADREALRCVSDVDSKIPCVCSPVTLFSALSARSFACAAYSRRIEYCWPVSGPDWPRRRLLRSFAPAAMQAFCCSCVSEALYFFEAAPKRSREDSCLGVRGSFGLTYRRRCCSLRRRYHTQSPHRPLFTRGSRHAPEGARKGQSRHPDLRAALRLSTAFRPLELFGTRAFMIGHAILVSAARQLWRSVVPPTPFPKPAGASILSTPGRWRRLTFASDSLLGSVVWYGAAASTLPADEIPENAKAVPSDAQFPSGLR